MKIIISPSKTQDFNRNSIKSNEPILIDKANEIVNKIQDLNKEDLKSIMKIKGTLLNETFDKYKNFNTNKGLDAILSYTGTVFKEINIDNYNEDEKDFLEENVVILSALYGYLKPFDEIKPYRLDMSMKVLNETLYKYWSDEINSLFINEDMIINLASKEYSKLIKNPMINIDFKEYKNGKYKSVGAYSKKARGMMLDYIVKNKITDVERIKKFNKDRYKYNTELSSNGNILFTR